MNTTNDQPWMTDASCAGADPECFFPPSGGISITITKIAKAICGTCDERITCLNYALAEPDLMGIWGGTTEKERDTLRGAA